MSQTPAPEFALHPEWDKAYLDTLASLRGQASRLEEGLGFSGESMLEQGLTQLEALYLDKVGNLRFDKAELRADNAELRAKVDELGKSIAALS